MKNINDLVDDLNKMIRNIDDKIVEANDKTALKIYDDVIELAPKGSTNNYVNSIKKYETEKDGNTIKTFIGSDLVVRTKWGPQSDERHPERGKSNNAEAGTEYNLGYLLENGTTEHAIPNAFDRGFNWTYTDEDGNEHKGTLEPDWHPGSKAIPHYITALLENKKLYKDNIKLAWRKL